MQSGYSEILTVNRIKYTICLSVYPYYNQKESKAQQKAGWQIISFATLPLNSNYIPMSFLCLSLKDPKALSDPIHQPQQPACKDPIQDHRPCDGEDLTPDTEDLALPSLSSNYKKIFLPLIPIPTISQIIPKPFPPAARNS